MKLQQTDWNNPAGATLVDTEFPDEPIRQFVNWLWTTKQWYENPEVVYRKFQRMKEELLASLGKPQTVAAPDSVVAWLERGMADPKVRSDVEALLKQYRREQATVNRNAALAKAREARAAKREASVAG